MRERRWVTADAVVSEVLRRFPVASRILLQHGGMFHAKKGDLYATFLPLTVAEYATRSGGIDVEGLLDLLNAAAESDEFARRLNGSHRPGGRQPGLGRGSTIGYTGAYREPDRVDVEEVVAVQTARGPQ